MWNNIPVFLCAALLAALLSACQNTEDVSTEQRLREQYGWKGTSLPKPVADPVVPAVKAEQTPVAPKEETGIVSTVNPSETVKTDDKEAVKTDEKETVKTEIKNEEQKSVSVSLPAEEIALPPTEYVVKANESLWLIAVKFYKNGHRWNLIYDANKQRLKSNPDSIRPGMKLVIPALPVSGKPQESVEKTPTK